MRSATRADAVPMGPVVGARSLAALAGEGLRGLVTRGAGWTPIGRAYHRVAGGDPAVPFARRALDELGVRIDLAGGGLERIPTSGPLVVVANHPFGAIDGLALLDLMARVRPDVKILANHLLRALPGVRGQVLAIDTFGGMFARRRNAAAVREAIAWLRGGRCVCVFPAGEVAHHERDGQVVDSAWRSTAADLAVRTGAAVTPIRFDGHNSRLFRLAGRVHPLLRTALLPREMWARRGRAVTVRVGEAIAPATLREQGDAAGRIGWLRSRVDDLARARPVVPVAERGDSAALEADVAALEGTELLTSGSFAVYCADALRLPAVLPEIGRLRELTFRAVGEGTGRARDLDRFDDTYLHLFVWDRATHEVAGAYRICPTDGLGPRGVSGLYTRTLFDFDRALVDRLGPALELGRSFVAPSYQRDYSPLLLLWKGIGRFVAAAPRYRRLFGAVSVSDRYRSTTRQLLASFLSANYRDPALAPLVRARRPLPVPRAVDRDGLDQVNNLEALSALVRRLEGDGKDMPVLLRQYLRLDAKLLAFSVDPAFGDALDGLLVVDLAAVDPVLLNRYLGRADAARFLDHHTQLAQRAG